MTHTGASPLVGCAIFDDSAVMPARARSLPCRTSGEQYSRPTITASICPPHRLMGGLMSTAARRGLSVCRYGDRSGTGARPTVCGGVCRADTCRVSADTVPCTVDTGAFPLRYID